MPGVPKFEFQPFVPIFSENHSEENERAGEIQKNKTVSNKKNAQNVFADFIFPLSDV